MTVPAVNLMDPNFLKDPVQGYGRLREQAPVVPVLFPNVPKPVWLITRYEEVKAALTDPRFVNNRNNVPGVEGPSAMEQMLDALGVPPEFRDYLNGLVSRDGSDHTRLRSLVAPAFSPRRMEAMRSHVERIAEELITVIKEKGEADLMADFAVPLAGLIICELIGVDEADRREVSGWIHNYSNSDPRRIIEAAQSLAEYTKALIARRRAEPADDLISKLISAVDENSDRMTEKEMMATVFTLVHTGNHATSHFIPNAVLTLLDHPDEVEKLRAEPALLPRAVDELLRVATPITLGTTMYAVEDLDFGGVKIEKGDTATVCLLSANRDPRVFARPDDFDMMRFAAGEENHLSFYHGVHYCLASALARVEGETAIDQLFLCNHGLSLAVDRSEVAYNPHPGGIFIAQLPVRL
jgi:cytochrome P450